MSKQKRPPGRPRLPRTRLKSEVVGVRLTAQEKRELDREARKRGITLSELVKDRITGAKGD